MAAASSSEPEFQPPEPTAPRRSRLRNLLVAALLLLAVTGGFLVYFFLEVEEQRGIIEELTLSQEDLEAEIKDLDATMEQLDAELAEANADREQKEQRIEQLLKQISYLQSQVQVYIKRGKLMEQEKERYQGMYEQLMFYNKKYRREIAALKAENEALRGQVAALSGDLDSLENKTQELQNTVTEQEITIESSKALTAINFRFFGVKRRDNAVEGNPLEARDIRKAFRVCFTVPKNPAAETGRREIFLVIDGPEGIVKNFGETSGYFEYNRKKKIYSAATTVRYNGRNLPVCIDYDLPEAFRFPEGRYTIAVYSEGFKLGQEQLVVE